MPSTKFLLIKARQVILQGNYLAASYYCELAAIHAENAGSLKHAECCRSAAMACADRVNAPVLSF